MKKIFPYILIISFLANCSPNAPSVPTIVFSTSTAIQPPVSTATNTIVPTNTPEIITENCLETKSEISRDDINGVVVLNGAFSFYDKSTSQFILNPDPSYLWDIKNDTKTELLYQKGEELKAFAVSPNHKFLVYDAWFPNGNDERVTVINAKGETINNVVNGDNWFSSIGWLNNDQIAVWALSDAGHSIPFSTLFYNPFTKDTKFTTPDYPNIYNWHLSNWNDTLTVYDPSISLVIYPIIGNTNTKDSIVLWDIKNQKQVTFLALASPEIEVRKPKWSPDGKNFIIGAILEGHQTYELYIVDSKGEIQQLTHFEDLIQRKEITSVDLWNYSWSSDGHFIAFWYRPNKQGLFRLALADTLTGQMRDLCIMNQISKDIIWSPDNTQILISSLINRGESVDDYRVLLIDIQDNYAVEIAEGLLPVGWLTTSH